MHDDAMLLRRYAEERSEEAFAELVRRHLNLVYFAALRRTSGDAHTAEDVAQQVFTALARDAAALSRHAVLTGWLYTTTRNLALKAMRTEQRRQIREQEAQAMHELTFDPAADADWVRLQPVLDDALDALPAVDREAVLLRFFHARPFADIGATLRLSEGAARMRVDRALDKLRAQLAKRGITSTSVALAAVLANQAAATAPAGLAASVTGAALSGAAVAETGAVAAVIAFMTATKTTAVLGIATALALTTAVYQSSQARTTAATLAAAGREHAAARARLAELDAKVRAAEQALAGREKTVAQTATSTVDTTAQSPGAAAAAADEAAKQQKALQQFLDSNPEFRAMQMAGNRQYWRVYYGPFLRSIGFTPEQYERAIESIFQNAQWNRAQRLAGLKPPGNEALHAQFRVLFGDAAADQFAEHRKNRWNEGEPLQKVSAALYYTDEPFTAEQTKRMIEILRSTGEKWGDVNWTKGGVWEQVLAKAGDVLSPAQMQGLRAVAAQARMTELYAAANKEAAVAAKK